MRDNVNEVGKYLKNSDINTQDALKKYKGTRPHIEHMRDVFDSVVPFEMYFKSPENAHTFTLDLSFFGPPPSGCCADCFCSVCEEFSEETEITLTYGYIEDTVRVFVDGELSTDFVETNPAGGVVTLGTTGIVVRICYIYSYGDCGGS